MVSVNLISFWVHEFIKKKVSSVGSDSFDSNNMVLVKVLLLHW